MQEIAGEDYRWEWTGSEISGIAIAARWPLEHVASQALLGDGDAAGGVALRAVVDSPIGPIGFTCATTFFFMSHHGFKRERQMPQLADFARAAVPASGQDGAGRIESCSVVAKECIAGAWPSDHFGVYATLRA